jgi:hypothetical protein
MPVSGELTFRLIFENNVDAVWSVTPSLDSLAITCRWTPTDLMTWFPMDTACRDSRMTEERA